MTIDWVALVVLGVAWAFSTVRTVPLFARHAVLALAFFGIAIFRLIRGAQGLGLVFVAVAAFFGVQYAGRAWRSYKTQTTPPP